MILAPSANPEAALELLGKRAIPTVLIDRFVPVELDQIATENIAPTARLVEHLSELGHRRIGIVAGLAGLATSEERVEDIAAASPRRRCRSTPTSSRAATPTASRRALRPTGCWAWTRRRRRSS